MTRAAIWIAAAMLAIAGMTTGARSEPDEKKVDLADVPQPVREAIVKAVGDGRLVDSTAAFQDEFGLSGRALVSTGRNRYFILEPGYRLVLEGKEGRHTVTMQITVLPETRIIGGVETRVVEERESTDGRVDEISRNFLAIDKESGSVFYFGEDVDIYEGGKVVAHKGAWMHGKSGARAGMIMPGEAALGARFYQEIAPGVAMDRAAIVDTKVTLETPTGVFRDCLKIREEDPLDDEREYKVHAPGVGLIQDEGLLLVKHGFVKP